MGAPCIQIYRARESLGTAQGMYMIVQTCVRTSPARSVAITSMRFGPSSRGRSVSKLPDESTRASCPLTLTVASGEVLPVTGISADLTMLLSRGEETSRVRAADWVIGVGMGVGVSTGTGVGNIAGVGVGGGTVGVGVGVATGVGATVGGVTDVGLGSGATVVGVETGVGSEVAVGPAVGVDGMRVAVGVSLAQEANTSMRRESAAIPTQTGLAFPGFQRGTLRRLSRVWRAVTSARQSFEFGVNLPCPRNFIQSTSSPHEPSCPWMLPVEISQRKHSMPFILLGQYIPFEVRFNSWICTDYVKIKARVVELILLHV